MSVRVFPDRRPRYSLWIKGPPRSSQSHGPSTKYIERVQTVARSEVSGASPLTSSALEVEIIFAARGKRPDVDNVDKILLDALCGIVYGDDKQVRAVKVVALRLDESFRCRGSASVSQRLLNGREFLVNVYEAGEVDVCLVDSKTPPEELPSVVGLVVARPLDNKHGHSVTGSTTQGRA